MQTVTMMSNLLMFLGLKQGPVADSHAVKTVPIVAKNDPLRPFADHHVHASLRSIFKKQLQEQSCQIDTQTGQVRLGFPELLSSDLPDEEYVVVNGHRLDFNKDDKIDLHELQWAYGHVSSLLTV
jgi:hypothetical protein